MAILTGIALNDTKGADGAGRQYIFICDVSDGECCFDDLGEKWAPQPYRRALVDTLGSCPFFATRHGFLTETAVPNLHSPERSAINAHAGKNYHTNP